MTNIFLFQCGGVTKEHYRQMVQLDESNIELNWECPPCHRKNNPSPDEPPQQTVSKLPPPPSEPTPSEPVIPEVTPSPPPRPVTMAPQPILPKPPANGSPSLLTVQAGNLNFSDVKIRDLPFYPVKATLLRPCTLKPSSKSVCDIHAQ